MLRQSIVVAVTGALLAAAPLAQASAHGRGWHRGWIGPGLLGAAVVGSTALLAAPFAYAAPPPRYYAPPAYPPPVVYYAPPVYGYAPAYGGWYRR